MLSPTRFSSEWKPPHETRENLSHELQRHGYVLCLLHPGQTHHFHQQQGLRAKTDRLDAMAIARMLLSGEARIGYVPSDRVATYRELVRLHTQLSDTAAGYQNEIQALVMVLFPECTQVFADPCLPTALSVLKAFPSAQALAKAGVEPLFQLLRAQPSAHYGPLPQRNWWPLPSRAGAVGERWSDNQSVCGFSAINWSTPKRILHV